MRRQNGLEANIALGGKRAKGRARRTIFETVWGGAISHSNTASSLVRLMRFVASISAKRVLLHAMAEAGSRDVLLQIVR